jgi:hypothetical protein
MGSLDRTSVPQFESRACSLAARKSPRCRAEHNSPDQKRRRPNLHPGTLGELAQALDTSPADLLEGYFKDIKPLAQARKLQANTPSAQFNTQINLGES